MLAIVEAEAAAVALPEEDEAPGDGIDYERYCAERLARAGWRAHRTPPSGDQGADIVAVRDGLRLIVQCKRLAKPVGNAAVQEAAAALRYWAGDRAAVVSNAGSRRRRAPGGGDRRAAPAPRRPGRHRPRRRAPELAQSGPGSQRAEALWRGSGREAPMASENFNSASAPETSVFDGVSSMLRIFTTPSSTSIA